MPLDISTAISIAGITCWDEDTSEDFGHGHATAPRVIVCPWDNRIALMSALLGGTTQAGIIQTNTPAASYPDATWLLADSVRTEGVGKRKVGVNGMVGYDFARLYITYAQQNKDFGQTQDLGALDLDIGSEIYSPPRDEPTFKWDTGASGGIAGDDITPEATPGITVTTATFVRVRRNLAFIPIPLILSLIDHVNDGPFEGTSKGKIIFKGARPSWRFTNLGVANADLALKFQWRSVEWNKFLSPQTGQFEPVVYKGSNKPPFPEGNLNALYL